VRIAGRFSIEVSPAEGKLRFGELRLGSSRLSFLILHLDIRPFFAIM
jgi:hypothetical protein